MWILGLTFCIFLAATDQVFTYRQNPIFIQSTICQILALPLGRLLEKALPSKEIKVPWSRWGFSLNPGPFNVKEHVLISMFANAGTVSPSALGIVVKMKGFYHRHLDPLSAIILILTVQYVGYGLAGMFMNIFVKSPYMWWPNILPEVSFYRALHEKEKKKKGHLTKMQFFTIVTVVSFAYYIIPSYFFPSIASLSFICWIWKDSVVAHQIGSGLHGLGLGSIALDWQSISSFLSSPLIVPISYIINVLVGFLLSICVLTPAAYFNNLFDAKRFPIFSANIFDDAGKKYDFSRVLDAKELKFDKDGYNNYSKPHMSIFLVINYGMTFAAVGAGFSQFAISYARPFWKQFTRLQVKEVDDIHNRLMKKYDPIPAWWFISLFIMMIGLSLLICEGFGRRFQIPFWLLFIAIATATMLIILCTTTYALSGLLINFDQIPLMIITYAYAGKTLGIEAFSSYTIGCYTQGIDFLSAFKLGHYMKIPPRSMFLVQVIGTLVSLSVSYWTTIWVFSAVDHLCDPELLPKGSPWTCTTLITSFSDDILSKVIGPRRVFFPDGEYSAVFLSFAVGMLAPILVWCTSLVFPMSRWLKVIDFSAIFYGGYVLPGHTVNSWSWAVVAVLYYLVVYRRFKGWWSRYNYLLSYGLEVGVALMALALLLTLNLGGIYGPMWWGLTQDDHCPLAQCPTAPGMDVEGCPVF